MNKQYRAELKKLRAALRVNSRTMERFERNAHKELARFSNDTARAVARERKSRSKYFIRLNKRIAILEGRLS